MSDGISGKADIDWKKMGFLFLGVIFFAVVYWSPAWPDAIDPMGKQFELSREAKGALAVFLLAGTWWVFEVVPIGITSLAIGVLQAMFLIRPAREAFTDFMVPSVMFIFASIMIGLVFTKTGLTKRLAYKMLVIVGEKTSMIYLGCFVVTAALTHIMAHTAVAATIYPLLVAIYAMYGEGDKQTKFGKGLFMGMAYVAGAGSIVTLLGAARGAVGLGFYSEVTGKSVGFFELTYYMAPIGWLMTFLLWGFFMVVLKPEKKTKKSNHVVKGVEHQGYGQPPSSVDSANKQEDEQTDGVQSSPKITKELDHGRFRGELVVDCVIKLIIHYGNNHVGHKGQD